ncbi:MAG: EAL domain-containing protein [Leptospiraceae bacterium]|nr:EAL domain-containing protein [Leptospiraceae bacterium]
MGNGVAFLACGVAPRWAVVSAAIASGQTIAAVYLLRFLPESTTTFRRVRDFFRMVFVAGFLLPLAAAVLAAWLLPDTATFWHVAERWAVGNSLGVITLAPLILLWRQMPNLRQRPSYWLEFLLAFGIALAIGQIVLAGQQAFGLERYLRAFMLFSFVVWAAVRFGRRATIVLITLFALQAVAGLVQGRGYLVTPEQDVSLLTIWFFVFLIATTGMALAIIIHEGGEFNRALEHTRERLQQVSALTRTGGWEYEVESQKVYYTQEFLELLEVPSETALSRESLLGLLDAEEKQKILAATQQALQHGKGWDLEFWMKTFAGNRLWVRSLCKPILKDGQVVRLFGAVHDLTQQKLAQLELLRKDSEFRSLVETASEGICILDREGRITFANKRLADILGYPVRQLEGNPLNHYLLSELSEILPLANAQKPEVRQSFEADFRHQSGRTVHAVVSLAPVFSGGEISGAYVFIMDITDRKLAEIRLKLSEAHYRQFVESLSDAIVVHQSGFIVYANPAAAHLVGAKSPQELLGRNAIEFVAPQFREQVLQRIQYLLHHGGEVPPMEEEFIRLDGTPVAVEVKATAIRFNDTPAVLVVARDITERKRAEEQIRYMGQHDALTGLPNRVLFADRLAQAIAHAERYNTIFALLYVDLDHFKKINDVYGHRFGDEFLRQVAARLAGRLRSADTISRQGGDEFVILLNELQQPEDAAVVARDLCRLLENPFHIDGLLVYAAASIGIAIYPRDGTDAETLQRNADIAMYHAKNRGRNQYQFFSEELNRILQDRLELEYALRQALDNNEFKVVYQPLIDLQTNAISGFETLLRWQHPQRGELAAAKFIPLAEDSGQIIALSEWLFNRVLSDIPQLALAGYPELSIAVNFSITELRQKDFAEKILRLLEQHGVMPRRLIIDISETALWQEREIVSQNIRQLASHGVRFAIDDFGTGNSSLSQLKSLPIHYIKIDASFIHDLPDSEEDVIIVRTILSLARNLKLETIAEGVESASQRDFLRHHGCGLAQGNYLAPPMELEAALRFAQKIA